MDASELNHKVMNELTHVATNIRSLRNEIHDLCSHVSAGDINFISMNLTLEEMESSCRRVIDLVFDATCHINGLTRKIQSLQAQLQISQVLHEANAMLPDIQRLLDERNNTQPK